MRKLQISSSMPSVSRATDSRNSACMRSCFTSLFSGFNNCSIGQICVNIKPTINQTVEQEFDTVVKDLEVQFGFVFVWCPCVLVTTLATAWLCVCTCDINVLVATLAVLLKREICIFP